MNQPRSRSALRLFAPARFRSKMRWAEDLSMREPEKLIPRWLTIDLLVIVVGLVIISIGLWIAP